MGQTPSKALLQAAEFGNVAYCNRALHEGANVNTRARRNHDTPLILASRSGHIDIVKILLQKNAQDSQNMYGFTPLMEAARRNRCAILALLLDYGCDPFRQNSKGRSALELAAERNHVKAVRLIESRVCSFYANIEVETSSWFSKRFVKRWITVRRRRPWDNPNVNAADVQLYIYSSLTSPTPKIQIIRPRIENAARDGMNVTFSLTGSAAWIRGKPDFSRENGPKPYVCTVSYDIYAWLDRVLNDSFMTGRSSAFDPASGCIIMPLSVATYASQFTSQSILRTEAGLEHRRTFHILLSILNLSYILP